MKRINHGLFQQIADILWLYSDDSSEKSKDALNDKYAYFVDKLSRQRAFPLRYCEREQFEYLMIWQVETRKWHGFKKCINDAGTIINARKDDLCSYYDWFLARCEDVFGKERVANYLNKTVTTNLSVKAFLEAQKNIEQTREENSRLRVEPVVTLESYISRAKELENDQYVFARMRISAKRFLKQATPDDISNLVSYIEMESSDEIRANLLRIFRDMDYPGDIEKLLNYAQSDYVRLQNIAVDALKHFKDKRIHDLALKFITEGNLGAGLPLLLKNRLRADEAIIRKQILSSKKVSHSLQMNISELYSKRRSNSCEDILMHVYENVECSFCRMGIVEAMLKNKVMSKKLLEECQFDSYDDTRKFTLKTMSRVSKTGKNG